jgi:hypothetical protein
MTLTVEQEEEHRIVTRTRTPRGDLGNIEDFDRAVEIYEMSVPQIAFRLGEEAEAYATKLANLAEEGSPRVRGYLKRMARREWRAFEADIVNPDAAMIDMIERIDIRRAGEMWYTQVYYTLSRREIIIRDKPREIDDALVKLRSKGYTVRAYGSTWYRAWPGSPTPVRNREQVMRARQQLDDGRLFVPSDYRVARDQINLAYDL